MRSYTTLALASLVVCFLAGASLRADDKKDASTDTEFLAKVMLCGMEEMKTADLAAKNASDEKVKEFAQRLVKDHEKVGKEIAENAKRLKVAAVTDLDKDGKDRMEKLSKLKGKDFDVEFLAQQIDAHEKAITLFEREMKSGTDKDLQTVAKDNLPILKKHLDEAREHQARLKK